MIAPAFERTRARHTLGGSLLLFPLVVLAAACQEANEPWPPEVQAVPEGSPVLSPQQALQTFNLPPGYRIELVAAEPLVEDPVALDFDPDGRIWVAEMRGYMPNVDGEGEDQPIGRIVVLEDTNGDGRMDRRTVFLDGLVLPRAIKVLDQGVLVAEPPHIWLARDTTGNLQADVKEAAFADYGDPEGNPEHLANGLWWGLDNWIHNTLFDGRFRMRNGTLEFETVRGSGQWGISMDDAGRLYRNNNSQPIFIDLVPTHYFERNPHLTRTRGRFEQAHDDRTVWPVRPTPGVNRGYRDQELREDSTLAQYTSASSLAVYRGDLLPEELRGNVFIPEPAGNLVQRRVLTEDENGFITARNPYAEIQADFLTSTDERFRPVNAYSGPDGALYIVDMYRGVIQHRFFLTEYLKNYIESRGLDQPVGYGRIYRIVPELSWRERLVHRFRRPPGPRLSESSTAELVENLSHPNGWWRDASQRLLVERQAVAATPALRQLAREGGRDYARLHALWTLDGLGQADQETLRQALEDPSPQVRAAALRISEPLLATGNAELQGAVLALLDDDAPAVRRQLAASLGTLPGADREDALAAVIERHGADPVVVDLAISGLADRETEFLARILDDGRTRPIASGVIETLVATVLNRGDPDEVRTVLAWIGEEERPAQQRVALLSGVQSVAPGNGRPGAVLELDHRPVGLLAAAEHQDVAVRDLARSLTERLYWPGRPRPERPAVQPLTPAEEVRFQEGERIYANLCAACHQPDGRGEPGVATSLVGSEWVRDHPRRLVRIILHGMDEEMLMPPMRHLSDQEVAAVLTYVRRAWGNTESPIDSSFVAEIRGVTTGREQPYSAEELRAIIRQ